MKTKLLKKVRKKYCIDKIIKVDKRFVNSIFYGSILPLYVLWVDDEYRYSDRDYDNVYKKLIYVIRNEYSHTIKRNRSKYEKKWWKG